jgi:hypothetical protein
MCLLNISTGETGCFLVTFQASLIEGESKEEARGRVSEKNFHQGLIPEQMLNS